MAGQGQGFSFEQYLNVRTAAWPSFSPDGKLVGFLTDITGVSEVWTVRDSGGESTPWPDQVTFRGERAMSATFAPTRDVLLVQGDVGGGELAQLFRVNADGTDLVALTDQPSVIHQFGGWSPDGTRICYASNARNPRSFDVYETTPDDAQPQPRLLFSSDDTNYAAGYSPDGKRVLVLRMENNVRGSLLLVDAQSGEARRLTPEQHEGHGTYAAPAFGPGGTGIYVLGDRGREFMSLAYIDLATGDERYLRDDPWDAEALALTPDGTRLALALNENGASRLELFDVSDGWERRQALPAPELPMGVARELVWSRDGRKLAFTLDPAAGNPDVWIWEPEAQRLRQLTCSARAGLPAEAFVEPRQVAFPTFDGRQIPALLYVPTGAEARNLPVVVYVHGGPESQFRPTFNAVVQYFISRGYGVLAPNVRGSTGYGYTYQSLDDVRKRMDSVADLKAAAEWLAASGVADARRIVVMGGSYGGFMTLSAVTTYPDLWAAAVDIVGIANFVPLLTPVLRIRNPTAPSGVFSASSTRETRSATGVLPVAARSALGRGRVTSTTASSRRNNCRRSVHSIRWRNRNVTNSLGRSHPLTNVLTISSAI